MFACPLKRSLTNQRHTKRQCQSYQTVRYCSTTTHRGYIDSHTHIDMTLKKLNLKLQDFPKFVAANFPPTWDGSIQVCCDPQSTNDAYELINSNDKVWAAFGVHPHNAELYSTTVEHRIIQAMDHSRTVAWGEMGLDYQNLISHEVQKDVFVRQIKCALKLGKPLVIHTRVAEDDTLQLMKDLIPSEWPIHIHCFTSSSNFADALLKYWTRLYIGFTGVITFAKQLHEVVQIVPLEKILLETDAPFMTPVPHRGKICHSGYIPLIAQKIAQIKNLDEDIVFATTRQNTKEIYGI